MIFFVKESIFSLATAVGRTMHLCMAAINKINPSYVWVEIQVDLAKEMPEYMKLEAIGNSGNVSRVERIMIQ